MAVSEKTLDRIKGLLAKAEGTDNEHEAAAFFEHAQRLMEQHAVDEGLLVKAGGKATEQIVTRIVKVAARDEIGKAKGILLNAIGRANRCTVYQSAGLGGFAVVGYESDTIFVEMLFSSVLMQYAGERTKAWKKYQAETPKGFQQSRHLFITGFANGYAIRVGERLVLAAERSAEKQEPGSALVLRDRKQDVDAWVNDNLKLRSRSVRVRETDGIGAGRAAGDRADLSGGRNNVGTRGVSALLP